MKKTSKTSPNILLSGGGTGGHLYPAIAIADEIKVRLPDANFLFVGAEGRMEMEKAPRAGYNIKGLPISGINRGNLLSNFKFPIKLVKSLFKAKNILKDFNPDIAIGTGGYASGPMLWVAARKNTPILLQEQNSFPGITNKILSKNASAICVAYEGMGEFFPQEAIIQTGNPIRNRLFSEKITREEAIEKFGLDPKKLTILSVGGSQGSRVINYAWLENLADFLKQDIQLIWQTGSLDFQSIRLNKLTKNPNIFLSEFIYEMNYAYAAADLVVSRAGAIAISELSALGKPTLLLPLPTAAEDHQTKNAEYLVERKAAEMLTDKDAKNDLVGKAIDFVKDEGKRELLSQNILKLAKPNATKDIVNEIMKLI